MEPLVSAVVITHNRKNLLEKALRSVLAQTVQGLELIVVDDGSVDGTRAWMESFAAAHPVRYIYNEDHLGGNHVRNIGIRAASGKYVALLDDDDEWLPLKTEKQLAVLEADPEVGVVCCGRIALYDDGREEREDPSLLPEGDLSQAIFTDLHFTSSRLMIRRALLEEVGLFDESLRAWQDFELMIRLCQKTRVAVVRENLVRYNVSGADPDRITNQVWVWADAVEYIQRKHRRLLEALPEDARWRHQIMVCRDGEARAERSEQPEVKRAWLRKELRLNFTAENLKRFLLNQRILKKPPLITRIRGRLSRLI